MKPISAEDNGVILRVNKRKGAENKNAPRIILLAIILAIAIFNYARSSSLAILDTDPSTYVIVPLLMLPLFALFYLKEKINAKVTPRDLILGTAMLMLFVFLSIFIREKLSLLWVNFKGDMLIFPLVISGLVAILFGAQEIKRFKLLIFYSIFASPAALMFLINQNQNFASFNSYLVYGMMHLLSSRVTFTAPVFIGTGSLTISIGESCAGLGAFIGLAMFLIPLAYRFEGENKKKALWVVSGLLLLMIFNILRMLSIGFVWLVYGPGFTIDFIHLFAGIILFYLAIILSFIYGKKFGLSFARIKTPCAFSLNSYAMIPILFAIFYLLITLNYASAQQISPITFGTQKNITFDSNFSSFIVNSLGSNWKGFFIERVYKNYFVFSLQNSSFNSSYPIIFAVQQNAPLNLSFLLKNATVLGRETYLDNSGTIFSIYHIISNNTEFYIEGFKRPFFFRGNFTYSNVYIIMPALAGKSNSNCFTYYDLIYTSAINVLNPSFYNKAEKDRITSAFCLIKSKVL